MFLVAGQGEGRRYAVASAAFGMLCAGLLADNGLGDRLTRVSGRTRSVFFQIMGRLTRGRNMARGLGTRGRVR